MSMASPHKDVEYMRCMHCQKVIRISRCDTSGLVRHVELDHPSKCTVPSKKCKEPPSSVTSQMSEKEKEQSCEKDKKSPMPASSEISDKTDQLSETSEKIKRMHMLAAQHGISEERLSEISRKTGLSQAQMADKAEKYMAKKFGRSPSEVSSGGEKNEPPTAPPQKKETCPPCACRSEKEQAHRRQCYRVSIRRWIPAEGCIFCPCCGCSRRPLIKAASEIMTSGCCATWVVICWPLCLLPCLLSSDNREYLYCSNCRVFLGIYEREKRCVRPSREFVSCCNSATPPPTAR